MNIIKKSIVSLTKIFDVSFVSKFFLINFINMRDIKILSEDRISVVMPSRKL
ncbi:hypothetical protein bcCo53_000072 [Borrelia coriaceae]|nr:hypothetical protein bcCo53_000072 [Borrelia coriaceae]